MRLITFFLIVIKILSLALIIDGLTTMCVSEFSPGLCVWGCMTFMYAHSKKKVLKKHSKNSL